MSYTCECGWEFVGSDPEEELLSRIEHLRANHFEDRERQFHGINRELIKAVHDTLHAIDCDELDGWYTSQIARMRTDACEILGRETDDHERGSVAINHDYEGDENE